MERITRISALAITVRVVGENSLGRVNVRILSRLVTPKDLKFARRLMAVEDKPLPVPIPQAYTRWGFELSPEYFEMLRAHPVPMPLALMKLFHNSPRRWDFAAWLLYRAHCARTESRPIPLVKLREQLGSTEAVDRKLKGELAKVIREIQVVLPGFPAGFNRQHELVIAPYKISSLDPSSESIVRIA